MKSSQTGSAQFRPPRRNIIIKNVVLKVSPHNVVFQKKKYQQSEFAEIEHMKFEEKPYWDRISNTILQPQSYESVHFWNQFERHRKDPKKSQSQQGYQYKLSQKFPFQYVEKPTSKCSVMRRPMKVVLIEDIRSLTTPVSSSSSPKSEKSFKQDFSKCEGHIEQSRTPIMSLTTGSTKPQTPFTDSLQITMMDIYGPQSKNMSQSFQNKKSSILTSKRRVSQQFNTFQTSPKHNGRDMSYYLRNYLQSNKDENTFRKILSQRERYARTPQIKARFKSSRLN